MHSLYMMSQSRNNSDIYFSGSLQDTFEKRFLRDGQVMQQGAPLYTLGSARDLHLQSAPSKRRQCVSVQDLCPGPSSASVRAPVWGGKLPNAVMQPATPSKPPALSHAWVDSVLEMGDFPSLAEEKISQGTSVQALLPSASSGSAKAPAWGGRQQVVLGRSDFQKFSLYREAKKYEKTASTNFGELLLTLLTSDPLMEPSEYRLDHYKEDYLSTIVLKPSFGDSPSASGSVDPNESPIEDTSMFLAADLRDLLEEGRMIDSSILNGMIRKLQLSQFVPKGKKIFPDMFGRMLKNMSNPHSRKNAEEYFNNTFRDFRGDEAWIFIVHLGSSNSGHFVTVEIDWKQRGVRVYTDGPLSKDSLDGYTKEVDSLLLSLSQFVRDELVPMFLTFEWVKCNNNGTQNACGLYAFRNLMRCISNDDVKKILDRSHPSRVNLAIAILSIMEVGSF